MKDNAAEANYSKPWGGRRGRQKFYEPFNVVCEHPLCEREGMKKKIDIT